MTYVIQNPIGTLFRSPIFDYMNDQRIASVNSLPIRSIADVHPEEMKKQRLESPELPSVHKMLNAPHQVPQGAHMKKEKISPDTRFHPYNNGSPDAFRSPELEAVVPRAGLDSAEEDAEEILVRMRHCNEWYTAQANSKSPSLDSSRHFDMFIDHSPPFYSPEFAPSNYPIEFFPPHQQQQQQQQHPLNVNKINITNSTGSLTNSNGNVSSPKGSLRHILDGQPGVPILPPPPAFFDHSPQQKRKIFEEELRFETDEDFFRKAKKKAKKECRTKFAGEEAVIQREINSGGLCFKTHKPKIQREYYYSKLSKTIFRWTCCGSQAKTHPDS